MYRRLLFLICVALVIGVQLPATAQDIEPEATIAALETRVAELEAMLTPQPTATRERPAVAEDPIDLGSGVQLDYYYLVDDGYGNVELLGEITNVTGEALPFPLVRFVVYDVDGNLIGALDGSSPLPALLPGETVPIDGFINDVSVTEIGEEIPTLCNSVGDPFEYGSTGLVLQDVSEHDRENDSFVVRGRILNETAVPTSNPVFVNALVYLPDGRYAGHESTTIDASIPAERTARFELFARGIAALQGSLSDDYTYELWVGTYPGGTVHSC